MTAPPVAGAPEAAEAPTFPAASLDRRFYAFIIDRLVAWTVDLLLIWLIARTVMADGVTLPGVALAVLTVLLVGLAFAVVQGLQGFTPGKAALGLRVVHLGSGTPVGVVPSMLRTLILGFAALPTFGLGTATLALTALNDPGRLRRGWHDKVTESIVVDVRPVPVEEVEADPTPRHIVNLTAMRLVPAPQPVPVAAPARRTPPTPPTATPAPVSPAPATPSTPATPPPPAPAGHVTAERTVVRDSGEPAGSARWRVTFDTGESFVVEGLALVGRRPEPRPGEPVRHTLALPSSDMSLSKTHAQFQVAPDGVLVVMDRGSTNGTVLVRQGVARELAAGTPTTLLTGDTVRFGDRRMTVVREP